MATSLGRHPGYVITTSYEVSVNNSYSNTQSQITISFTSIVGTYTSVFSDGVKVQATCNGSTQGPEAIVGCKTGSGSWDSAGTYTKSFTFIVNKSSSIQSVSYAVYAYQGNGLSTGPLIGSNSGSVTVSALPVTNYSHTINHYYIGFNGETGTLPNYPNHYLLTTTTVTIKKGNSIKYSDYATTIPSGSELRSVNSGVGSNLSPTASYTQGTGSESWNFYYYPYNYRLTYELDGGSLPTANPSSYNILYGKTINQPKKSGNEFLGWEVVKEKLTYTAGGTDNWNYVRVYENCEPGVTYTITIDNARVTSGSASQFTTLIYDFTNSVVIASAVTNFGANRKYTITCPKNANPTHELILIVYAAVAGSTANIYSSFDGTVISYFSPAPTYSFDINNIYFELNGGINGSTGEYSNTWPGYAATPNLIPIEPGTVLYSNKTVCGIHTYDSNGNYIKRESFYTLLHPISSNAAYIRIEVFLNYEGVAYLSDLKINNEMGINKGLNADFSSTSVLYTELNKRTSGAWTFYAKWKPFIPQNIYLCKDGKVYARQFIESNDFYFTKEGDIYAPSFIIGDKISFSPLGLMATAFISGFPQSLYALIDSDGNILIDKNSNILEYTPSNTKTTD